MRAVLRAAYRRLERSPAAPLLRLPAMRRVHRRMTATQVGAGDVIELVHLLESERIDTILLGGWGCEALLGEQTREHGDVDLLLRDADRQRALELLDREGFELIYTFDAPLSASLVMELTDHRRRRSIAVHFADLVADSDGWRDWIRARITEHGLEAGELFSTGTIGGVQLQCLSARAQLALHTGYEPTAIDRHDVRLLCSRFSLPLPPGYESPADAA